MTFDINTEKNINLIATGNNQPAAVSTQSTKAPNSINVVENVGENADTYKANGNELNVPSDGQNLDSIYKSLAPVFTQLGISLKDAKDAGLVERVTGRYNKKDFDQLISVQDEIKRVNECLKGVIEYQNKHGVKLNIDEIAAKANDYNIALETKWSINGCNKHVFNDRRGLEERLEAFNGKEIDITKLSEQEQKDYIYKFFTKFFEDKIQKGESPEKIEKLQLQTFGKILINSSDEEKEILKHAVKGLLNENKLVGLKSYFKSFDSLESQTHAADNINAVDIEEITGTDIKGEKTSKKLATELTAEIYSHKSENGIRETHKETNVNIHNYIEKNKDALKEIDNLIKQAEEAKGSKLTEEEIYALLETEEQKEIYHKSHVIYTAIQAGEMVGTGLNYNVDESVKQDILTVMNTDAYELPYYRNVLENIANYIEEYKDIPQIAEQLKNTIDNATNNNLSVVIDDIKNGTTTELKAPTEQTSEENTAAVVEEPVQSVASENNNTSRAVQNRNNSTSNNENVETRKNLDSLTQAITEEGSIIKGIAKYVEEVGLVAALVEIFTNRKSCEQFAIWKYEDNEDKQLAVLHKVSSSRTSKLLRHTSNEVLSVIDPNDFSYYQGKLVEEFRDERKERLQFGVV